MFFLHVHETLLDASRGFLDDLAGEVGAPGAVGEILRGAAFPQGAVPGPAENGFGPRCATVAADIPGREPQRFRGPLPGDAFEGFFIVGLRCPVRLTLVTGEGAEGDVFGHDASFCIGHLRITLFVVSA